MPRLLALLALSVAVAACAGPPAAAAPAPMGEPLGIGQPPSGALTDAQLDRVASDIRRLEAAPLAPDAADARQVLLVWLTGSPDVSITVCPGLSGMGEDGRSMLSTALGMQSIFSEAAYRIESGGNVDATEARIEGTRGLVRSYGAVHAIDPTFSNATFDRLRDAEERGALAEAVREAGC